MISILKKKKHVYIIFFFLKKKAKQIIALGQNVLRLRNNILLLEAVNVALGS